MAPDALAQSIHPMRGDTGKSPQLSRTPSGGVTRWMMGIVRMSCCEAGLHQTSRRDRAKAVPRLASLQVHETTTNITDNQVLIAVAVEITGGRRCQCGDLGQGDLGTLETWFLAITKV